MKSVCQTVNISFTEKYGKEPVTYTDVSLDYSTDYHLTDIKTGNTVAIYHRDIVLEATVQITVTPIATGESQTQRLVL